MNRKKTFHDILILVKVWKTESFVLGCRDAFALFQKFRSYAKVKCYHLSGKFQWPTFEHFFHEKEQSDLFCVTP